MSDIINKQKGDNNTQIGEQTIIINNGLSSTEACQLAMDLFYENFPKLQQIAKDIAYQRAEELSNGIITELRKRNYIDLSAFSDPDIQYVLLEAQKHYARFGEKEKLTVLTKLVADRIMNHHNNNTLKVAIDKAISIAGVLNTRQMDFLSLLFITTKTHFNNINTIDDLSAHFREMSVYFPEANKANWELLSNLGCLTLVLHDPIDVYVKSYGFEKTAVQEVCPELIKELCYDYYTSPIGTVVAIINAEIKTPYEFDYNIWIHD